MVGYPKQIIFLVVIHLFYYFGVDVQLNFEMVNPLREIFDILKASVRNLFLKALNIQAAILFALLDADEILKF